MTFSPVLDMEAIVVRVQKRLEPEIVSHYESGCECGQFDQSSAGAPSFINQCTEFTNLQYDLVTDVLSGAGLPQSSEDAIAFLTTYPSAWTSWDCSDAETLIEALHNAIRRKINEAVIEWVDGCMAARILQEVDAAPVPVVVRLEVKRVSDTAMVKVSVEGEHGMQALGTLNLDMALWEKLEPWLGEWREFVIGGRCLVYR